MRYVSARKIDTHPDCARLRAAEILDRFLLRRAAIQLTIVNYGIAFGHDDNDKRIGLGTACKRSLGSLIEGAGKNL